ncbi:1-hydroxy-2-methyl-2-butenyl 4-diphosphate reductase [Streptomyces sp. NPDC059037]|uniref:phosphorylase family protein n=1 Tax=Streptomyces sp. NPDC059037 TaxID=3346710 RepID=UPI0036A3CDA0
MAKAPARPDPAPLLIACALGIERLALRTGERGGAQGRVTVLRTGMGSKNAERAVTGALGKESLHDASVVATGFCAGLAPGMHPGDLVVAEETRSAHGRTPCVGTGLLVKELVRALPGRTVHTGPLIGSDHVVRGHERADLLATGAIAVDMESAATLHSAVRAGRPPPRAPPRAPGPAQHAERVDAAEGDLDERYTGFDECHDRPEGALRVAAAHDGDQAPGPQGGTEC